MKGKQLINEFCNKYDVDVTLLKSYLGYIEMGDLLNADVYQVLISDDCSMEQKNDLETDLKELTKKYFEKI